jgi:hypothetical protein
MSIGSSIDRAIINPAFVVTGSVRRTV